MATALVKVEGERDFAASTEAPVTLGDCEERLRGLTALAGANLDPEVQKVILELVQLDVVPTAIAQVLKSLCNKARQHKKLSN